MPKKLPDTRPETIYCACGCGEIVPKKRYPSQQNFYINMHQHRGQHNGNYKGGAIQKPCPVCGESFIHKRGLARVTCGKQECYIEWQRMTTSARGRNRVETKCAYCGRALHKFPSQIKERNYCNRHCLAADNPRIANLNGNWQGGKWNFIKHQAMLRDNYQCVICGFDFHVHVHHITPLADDGTNEFSNLITLCPNHHAMADLGIIDLEHLRNYEWQPNVTTDPMPHANR